MIHSFWIRLWSFVRSLLWFHHDLIMWSFNCCSDFLIVPMYPIFFRKEWSEKNSETEIVNRCECPLVEVDVKSMNRVRGSWSDLWSKPSWWADRRFGCDGMWSDRSPDMDVWMFGETWWNMLRHHFIITYPSASLCDVKTRTRPTRRERCLSDNIAWTWMRSMHLDFDLENAPWVLYGSQNQERLPDFFFIYNIYI